MRVKILIALMVMFALLGCLQQEQPQVIVNESYEEPQLNITPPQIPSLPTEETENISEYSFSQEDTTYVVFFNLGKEKMGRLILIKKGDLDIYIYSVPDEYYEKAKILIEKNSDDVEYLIVPSPHERNIETLPKLLSDIEIGNVIYPEIPEFSNTSGTKIDHGEILNLSGLELRFFIPGKDLENPENRGFIVELWENGSCEVAFMLDSLNGALTPYVGKISYNCKYMEAPHYGMGISNNPLTLLVTKLKPKAIVVDGPDREYQTTTAFIDQLANIKEIEVYKVWHYSEVDITFGEGGDQILPKG